MMRITQLRITNFSRLFTLILFALLVSACGKDSDPEPEPSELVSCIQLPEESPKVNEPVAFTSCSENATSWLWEFGDGATLTTENPEYTYTAAGTFTVKLTVKDDENRTHTSMKTLTILEVDAEPGSECIKHFGGYIRTNETWAKGCHILQHWLQVEDGATLTIEPGAVVRFEPGAGISVTAEEDGTIIAEGTEAGPILFTSNQETPAPGDWSGFYFPETAAATASSFRYCIFEYAGLDLFDDPVAVIRVADGGRVKVSHCEFRYGNSYALAADSYGGFELFTNNYIHDFEEFAIYITGNQAGTIGEGNVIDNKGVLIAANKVTMDSEWKGLTCPYVTESNLWVGSETGNTLTLGPGVRIEFQNTQELLPSSSTSIATLITNGTAESPVVFTSHTPDEIRRWGGIALGKQFTADSYFRHTIFEKAQSAATHKGVITVGETTLNMENCSISGAKGYGIYMEKGAKFGTFKNNDFGEIATFSIYIQMQNLETLAQNTFSGGKDVDLGFSELTTDVVFPELPVYYHVDSDLWMGSEEGNTVTFSPGSKFLMVGKTIEVGQSYPAGSGDVPVTFHAVGTPEKPIIIKRVEYEYSSGDVVTFSGTAVQPESIMEYCHVIGGSTGIRVSNLYNDPATPFPAIRNCTISGSSGYAIRVANSHPLIENNTYVDNGNNDVYVLP